ncbi:hypothetical protein EE612_056815 [Oryza sativa]|nr:hypothetical protein EE612_056815 [Oryza sativa]
MAHDGAAAAATLLASSGDNDDKPRRRRNMYAFGCATLASMTTILMGYNLALMSGAQLFVREDMALRDAEIEVLTGSMNVFMLVSILAAGWAADVLGRRGTLVLANAFLMAGALAMSLGATYAASWRRASSPASASGSPSSSRPCTTPRFRRRPPAASCPRCSRCSSTLGSCSATCRTTPCPACPRAPWLARHVRRRRGPSSAPRRGRARHAGVAALARHARSPRRRARGARAHLRLRRGGRAPPRGDQARRRGATAGGWRRRVAGAALAADGDGPPDPHVRGRPTVLPASVGRQRGRALQPGGVQEGRHGVEHLRPGRHRRRRGRQDVLHPRRHALLRPPRLPPAPAGQHGRHGRHPDLARPHAPRRAAVRGERRGVRGVSGGVRRGVLGGARADDGGVHRGGVAAAAARAGREPRHRREPADVRRDEHEVLLGRRRDHHGRVLLPLRRRGGGGVRVRARAAAGDARAKLGGHGRAVPQVIVSDDSL